MNVDANNPSYKVIKATKNDKKDILRFYKTQRYPARYIGRDQCYFIKTDNLIIACAMISAGQEDGHYWLLHALATNISYRQQGLASLLLQAIMSEKKNTTNPQPINNLHLATYPNIICFADAKLQPFYLANGFIPYHTSNNIQQLPLEFQLRLLRYQEKQPSLCCYLYTT